MNYWNSIQPDHTFQDRTVIMRIQHCLRYLKDPEKIVNLRNLWPFVLSLRTIYERPSDNASYLLFLGRRIVDIGKLQDDICFRKSRL